MKKIMLCLFLLLGIVGCQKDTDQNTTPVEKESKIEGYVVEIQEDYIMIQPLMEYKLEGTIQVTLPSKDLKLEENSIVEVVYDGAGEKDDSKEIHYTNEINVLAIPENIIRQVHIDGITYYDTSEISTEGRCGMNDGKIQSTVKEYQKPEENNQSNFGVGYEYCLIENAVIVVIDGQDHIFTTVYPFPAL